MLQLCIRSIRQNSFYQHQLIVHINKGSDGSLEWIASQSDIDYTYSEENVGVCYALNAAASLATTDYILYINDDMYACPHWDKYLMDEIEVIGHKYFFLSSTMIEPLAQSRCSIATDFGTTAADFAEDLLLKEYDDLSKADWMGATWPPNVVHRDVWNLVGGYSTEFSPGMYSDPDFSMKLWMAGVRYFKGLGKSRVYHFGSASVRRIKKNRGYYQFISKWGLTAGSFSKYYLRRGELFTGPAAEPDSNFYLPLKSGFKQVVAMFKR